jgi:hypothetical protein
MKLRKGWGNFILFDGHGHRVNGSASQWCVAAGDHYGTQIESDCQTHEHSAGEIEPERAMGAEVAIEEAEDQAGRETDTTEGQKVAGFAGHFAASVAHVGFSFDEGR